MATKTSSNLKNNNFPKWLILVVIGLVVLAGLYFVYKSLAGSESTAYLETVNCRDDMCFVLTRNGTVEKQAYIKDVSDLQCNTGLKYKLVEQPTSAYQCLPK